MVCEGVGCNTAAAKTISLKELLLHFEGSSAKDRQGGLGTVELVAKESNLG